MFVYLSQELFAHPNRSYKDITFEEFLKATPQIKDDQSTHACKFP